MSKHTIGLTLTVLMVAALLGCGGDKFKMAPVTGTVTLAGKPLEKVMVEFWPEAEGPRSIAVTDAAGQFKLMTDDGKHTGAVVGAHKVVLKDVSILNDEIRGRAAADVDLSQGRKPRISTKYSSAQTTMLTETVQTGENNFTLEPIKF